MINIQKAIDAIPPGEDHAVYKFDLVGGMTATVAIRRDGTMICPPFTPVIAAGRLVGFQVPIKEELNQ